MNFIGEPLGFLILDAYYKLLDVLINDDRIDFVSFIGQTGRTIVERAGKNRRRIH